MKGFGRLGVKTAAFYVSTSFVSILLGLARVMGVQLGFGGHFFVVVATLLTSIGLAGIPSASLMAILLILKAPASPARKSQWSRCWRWTGCWK